MLYSTPSSLEVYNKFFPDAIDHVWIGDVNDAHGQQLLAQYAAVRTRRHAGTPSTHLAHRSACGAAAAVRSDGTS